MAELFAPRVSTFRSDYFVHREVHGITQCLDRTADPAAPSRTRSSKLYKGETQFVFVGGMNELRKL